MTACTEDNAVEIAENTKEFEMPKGAVETVKVSKDLIEDKFERKNRYFSDGRQIDLFAAPPYPADSVHGYSIKEDGRYFIIRVAQYGKSWIAKVVDFTPNVEPKAYKLITAPSPDVCLQLIRKRHSFTGEFKKLLMD